MKKQFHLGDVLTVTSGALVSYRYITGWTDILSFLVGESIYPHQIHRVNKECRPHLLRQFPQLAEVDGAVVTRHNRESWLAEQIAKYGEMLDVEEMLSDAHEHKDPVAEMIEIAGPEKVMVVKL